MTLGGWISLFPWCLYKVLTTPDQTKKLHGFDRYMPNEGEESNRNKEKKFRGNRIRSHTGYAVSWLGSSESCICTQGRSLPAPKLKTASLITRNPQD